MIKIIKEEIEKINTAIDRYKNQIIKSVNRTKEENNYFENHEAVSISISVNLLLQELQKLSILDKVMLYEDQAVQAEKQDNTKILKLIEDLKKEIE